MYHTLLSRSKVQTPKETPPLIILNKNGTGLNEYEYLGYRWNSFVCIICRDVNRFWKKLLNDRFFVLFSYHFQKLLFRFWKKSFLKTTHSFWTLRKRIMIVSENYNFYKNNQRSLTTNLKSWRFWKKLLATLWNVVLYEA